MKISIKNRLIGFKNPCFIIAEAGVNHNGDIRIAKKLIEEAKKAGANAIKFQTFKTEELVTKGTRMAAYQKKNLKTENKEQYAMLKRLELSHENFIELEKHCEKTGIMFLSTAHTESEIAFLDSLVSAHKIASGDLTNIPFLKRIACANKPVILSTGMGTMEEVKEAIRAIKSRHNKKIVILHCTTNYPCPLEEVNLRAMLSIQAETGQQIGYSDHTEGIGVSILAVAMGAKVIEKHFTLDKTMLGPDHKASLEPHEFNELTEKIRETEKILGSPIKTPTNSEKEISAIARKSIAVKIDIPKGTKITANMLIAKRPGTGIAPKYISKIVGRKAKKDILADTLIKPDQI